MHWYNTKDIAGRWLGMIFTVAIIVRLLFCVTGYVTEGPRYFMTYSDSHGYLTIATNLVERRGFSMSEIAPFEPDSIRIPGYPYFLAFSLLLFGNPWLAILIQILLGAFTPLLLYEVLRRFQFTKRVALIVAGIIAIEPLQAAFSVFLTSESIFIFLFLGSLLLMLEYLPKRSVALLFGSAVLWGLATIVRPIALYTLLLFALFILWHGGWRTAKAWSHAGAYLLIGFIVLAPWMTRNLLYFNSFQLSAVPYYNMYVWHGGSVRAMHKGTAFDKEREALETVLIERGFDVTSSLGAKEFMKKGAREIMRAHPLALLKLDSYNAWKFFTMDGYYDLALHLGFYKNAPGTALSFIDFKSSLHKLPKLLMQNPMFFLFVGGRLAWILLLIVALWGVYLSLRIKEFRKRDVFLIFLVGYFMLASLTTGYGMNARFRMPIAPFYLAYIVLSLGYGASYLRKRSAAIYTGFEKR